MHFVVMKCAINISRKAEDHIGNSKNLEFTNKQITIYYYRLFDDLLRGSYRLY